MEGRDVVVSAPLFHESSPQALALPHHCPAPGQAVPGRALGVPEWALGLPGLGLGIVRWRLNEDVTIGDPSSVFSNSHTDSHLCPSLLVLPDLMQLRVTNMLGTPTQNPGQGASCGAGGEGEARLPAKPVPSQPCHPSWPASAPLRTCREAI